MIEIMSEEHLSASLSITDLTNPVNGIHAINIVVEKIREGLMLAYPETSLEELRVGPVVSVKENYDKLLFPADNAGRSSRYTRYVSQDSILMTHTSVGVTSWLEKKSGEALQDCTVMLPGMCYRRDVVDKTHSPEPHQMDVWRIKRGNPRLTRADLINLIETILNVVVPGYNYRANEVQHPYTLNGLEVEVAVGDGWLEVLECGEAHPLVLKNAGLNPEEYSGLALGMGLDRLVMVAKKIDDIRVLRLKDPRIAKQMLNLSRYIPVSNQPATKRVLSYSTSVDKKEEDVCEEIRDSLGTNGVYLEKVAYSEVSYADLTEKARENLGIRPDQKNVVVTLTLRSLEGSLAKGMVNAWMEVLYRKLNQGSRGYM